jgi:uncharacterized membrane protein YhhN
MNLTLPLAVAALICGVGAILTAGPGRQRWHYVLKPVTTSLILLLALLAPANTGPGTRLLIVLGLAASLIGDIWLMLPRDRFVAGLASFALTQVCYIAAFGGTLTAMPALWTYLPYLAIAGLVCALLWRNARQMRLPVLVYALLLVSMAWLAGARWAEQRTTAALLAWAGGLLFVASDGLLAANRFRRPIPQADVWILATFYAGQLLIALAA